MPTPYKDVAHLVRRTGFGANQSEISALAQLQLEEIVELVLDANRSNIATPVPVAPDIGLGHFPQWKSFTQWWLDRMAASGPFQAPLVEKMTLFWHNFLPSHLDKSTPAAMTNQNEIFRALGMGPFQELIQAVSITPAMFSYLDNNSNTKTKPNENWARESLELDCGYGRQFPSRPQPTLGSA